MAARILSPRVSPHSLSRPLLDFLAPRALSPHTPSPTRPRRRHHSTAPTPPHHSTAPTPPHNPPTPTQAAASHHDAPATTSTPPPPATPIHRLTPAQRAFLSSALRVNQTGELAAILIYASQTPLLSKTNPHLRPLLKHMYAQEAGHHSFFNAILAKHRIRPTAMTPVWTAAASFLGWSTAFLGREAAMACTEAVETEIGTHYNEQVRVLLDWEEKCRARGERLGGELEGLLGELRRIRDEELEHLDTAVENDAKEARPYEVLTEGIRAGCRGAIWVSERV